MKNVGISGFFFVFSVKWKLLIANELSYNALSKMGRQLFIIG